MLSFCIIQGHWVKFNQTQMCPCFLFPVPSQDVWHTLWGSVGPGKRCFVSVRGSCSLTMFKCMPDQWWCACWTHSGYSFGVTSCMHMKHVSHCFSSWLSFGYCLLSWHCSCCSFKLTRRADDFWCVLVRRQSLCNTDRHVQQQTHAFVQLDVSHRAHVRDVHASLQHNAAVLSHLSAKYDSCEVAMDKLRKQQERERLEHLKSLEQLRQQARQLLVYWNTVFLYSGSLARDNANVTRYGISASDDIRLYRILLLESLEQIIFFRSWPTIWCIIASYFFAQFGEQVWGY